ncbi:MAG: 3-isopropylmalate dehydratase small subunit [Hydrogenophaga sp.]|nr:3-isopropylmalate dehydratase small subunit [Hydrogenophaga sp.]
MKPFDQLQSLVVPVDRANVDTDALIPKQFMKSISRTGFGDNLFDEWRYLDRGEPGQDVSGRLRNPAFSLNQARYAGAQILLTRENFGCGSSREHAVWALADHGIRVLLAPSYADIFFNNCFKNGLLPIVLPTAQIDQLFQAVHDHPGFTLSVDLPTQTLRSSTGLCTSFSIDASRKQRLVQGLDDIGLTLQKTTRIRAFEAQHRLASPWLFN